MRSGCATGLSFFRVERCAEKATLEELRGLARVGQVGLEEVFLALT